MGSPSNQNPSSILSSSGILSMASFANPEIAITNSAIKTLDIGKNFDTSTSINVNLQDIQIQTSSYGRTVPVVYGFAKVAGNVVWTSDFRDEIQTSTTTVSQGKGQASTKTSSVKKRFVDVAVAICEGQISKLARVYVDENPIDLSQYDYTFYNGGETQEASSVIQADRGTQDVPGMRGISYIVFRNIEISASGARVPNFTFEVCNSLKNDSVQRIENAVESIIMIPGSGEFVYDSKIQYKSFGQQVGADLVTYGTRSPINSNTDENVSDVSLALSQLKQDLPNVKWVAPVVTWFGNSINAANCSIYPAVEYKNSHTAPDEWRVGGFTRQSAAEISKDSNGRPTYGGTINDGSIVNFLQELKGRGYKVMFLPMFFMDMPSKPWRGRLTGSAQDVRNFFTKEDGYNKFVLHYANLAKGHVDAFVIGSELVGLTSVKGSDNKFPAVEELMKLATQVKQILGSGVKVTYAADWTEYHHTSDGWYNMDSLWAHEAIDVIGIDAYFPLTDERESVYSIEQIKKGWESGEGYTFYYEDLERRVSKPLSPEYAWKNIKWFWENTHKNPDGNQTSWVPKSKKIWFTEYGFPSVDCASNQPNVFYDPTSSESAFPRYSQGSVDLLAQRQAIVATEEYWRNSEFVEQKFLWTWDARPYPFFPDLINVWSDSGLWQYGHWINGKLGFNLLSDVVKSICMKAGMAESKIDTSSLLGVVPGFTITTSMTALDAINLLSTAYNFSAIQDGESGGVGGLKFLHTNQGNKYVVDDGDLVELSNSSASSDTSASKYIESPTYSQSTLPSKVEIMYIDQENNYKIGNKYYEGSSFSSQNHIKQTVKLPVLMNGTQAQRLAGQIYQNITDQSTTYSLRLPLTYGFLKPLDVISINVGEANKDILVRQVDVDDQYQLKVSGTSCNFGAGRSISKVSLLESNSIDRQIRAVSEKIATTDFNILDLPNFTMSDSTSTFPIFISCSSLDKNWSNCNMFASEDGGGTYSLIGSTVNQSVSGYVFSENLPSQFTNFINPTSSFEVGLIGDNNQLSSISREALLSSGNLALLGNEIISFGSVEFLEKNRIKISNIVHGRFGTEGFTSVSKIGKGFTFLSRFLTQVDVPISKIGSELLVKVVANGQDFNDAPIKTIRLAGNALRNFNPVITSQLRDENGSIALKWQKRSRIFNGWQLPNLETEGGYVISISSSNSPAVKVYYSGTEELFYSTSQQVSDFGDAREGLNFSVTQNVKFLE